MSFTNRAQALANEACKASARDDSHFQSCTWISDKEDVSQIPDENEGPHLVWLDPNLDHKTKMEQLHRLNNAKNQTFIALLTCSEEEYSQLKESTQFTAGFVYRLKPDESGGREASNLMEDIKFQSAHGHRILHGPSSVEHIKHAFKKVLGRPVFGISEDSDGSVLVRIHISGQCIPAHAHATQNDANNIPSLL